MQPRTFAFALLSSALTLAGCAGWPTESDGIAIDATISRSVIAIGDSATFTIRLRNLTSEPITLSFGDSCQIQTYVVDATGRVVYPSGDQWGCMTVVTTLTLPPFGESVGRRTIVGDSEPHNSQAKLPRGRYRGYAALQGNSNQLRLRSGSVPFEVR